MVCTTVILLVVLCFICLLVFLRTTENRKKIPKKEGFTTKPCNIELTCPGTGQLKHTIYKEDDRNKQSGCCETKHSDGMGRYFTKEGCKACPFAPADVEKRLTPNGHTRIDSSNTQSSNSTTIDSCYAECRAGGKAPYIPGSGMYGEDSYNDSNCDNKRHYSSVGSDMYLETTSQTIEDDESCSNITRSNAHNSNAYCCSNDTWLRYNSNYKTSDALHGRLGCCPSNQYLDSNGTCSSCPKDQFVSNDDASNSGINACYIKNCSLGPPKAYYNDTPNSGYNCYSNYYHYSSLSSPLTGVKNIISEGSNDISFDGSNYFYPHDSNASNTNNTIGSNNFDTSSNWYYDNGHISNDNSKPSDNLKTTLYLQQPTYSNYYECNTNTFLRCENSPDTTPGTRSCICCGSNQYNLNADESCVYINSNTQEIADSNLTINIKGECDPGWGKSNEICVPCSNYEYSAGESNTCERCPHGRYPKSDRSKCDYANVNLTQSNYRIKDTSDTSAAQYLHYNNSNLFVKSVSNNLLYGDPQSNMYVWEDKSTPTQYYLQVQVEDGQGNFLVNSTDGLSLSLNNRPEKTGSLTFNLIPYCPAGQYADGDSCSNCPAGTWSSTPGLEDVTECSNCPAGTYNDQTGRSSNCTPCSIGDEYQDDQGQSSCKTVDEGYYKVSYSNIEQCPRGYMCTGGARTACLALNKYQNEEGKSNCKTVTEGYYKVSNSNIQLCSIVDGTCMVGYGFDLWRDDY